MTDAPDLPGVAATDAQAELDRLNAQVTTMRTVLTQLLQDVVRAERQVEEGRAAQLLEANERLMVSALGAITDAEIANVARDKASQTGGLDPLTGLPTRAVLLDRLESAIFNSKRHGNRVALLFLDLDGFKQVNDEQGHAAGDQALQRVADCLRTVVRETDTVSRHGGDEFLIVLAEVALAADAAIVAEKVNAALREHDPAGRADLRLTASIGISVYPEDGADAKTLIDRADQAMYFAKKQALGGFVFYADQATGQSSLPAPSVRAQHQRMTHHELEMAGHELQQAHLREANEQLVMAALGAQELLAAAEETRRRQATLLAWVANELRSPFAPIRLAAAALGRPDAASTLLPRAQAIIEQQVDKILGLVSGLLDPPSRGEAPLPAGRQSFDAAASIGVAVDACRPAVEERAQTLDLTISGPLRIDADPTFLIQTLMSLISQASACTGLAGRIRCAAEVAEGRLCLTVVATPVDGGPGHQFSAALPASPQLA